MTDKLSEIEESWSQYFEDADGPPVADLLWLIAEVRELRRRTANAEKLAQDSAKLAEEMRKQRDRAEAEVFQLRSIEEDLLQQLSHAASENALLKEKLSETEDSHTVVMKAPEAAVRGSSAEAQIKLP